MASQFGNGIRGSGGLISYHGIIYAAGKGGAKLLYRIGLFVFLLRCDIPHPADELSEKTPCCGREKSLQVLFIIFLPTL